MLLISWREVLISFFQQSLSTQKEPISGLINFCARFANKPNLSQSYFNIGTTNEAKVLARIQVGLNSTETRDLGGDAETADTEPSGLCAGRSRGQKPGRCWKTEESSLQIKSSSKISDVWRSAGSTKADQKAKSWRWSLLLLIAINGIQIYRTAAEC